MFLFQPYCRAFQRIMYLFAFILPWRTQTIESGPGCLARLPDLVAARGLRTILFVTDRSLTRLGLPDPLLAALDQADITVVLYDQTATNPTIVNIEDALRLYKVHACQGIIAFGGGSPIDCAKGVAARVARPRKSIRQMRGLLKVLGRIPPLFVVPTTSGTGSEATIVAVIHDPDTREKYAITDISLMPHVALLDPLLTRGLPPPITATTGMDALTHAVEAYIGQSNTRLTRQKALAATGLVFRCLENAFHDGTDLAARTGMQQAAYQAGVAFTRAYVGNVHAIAHALGGLYGVPHGLANAIVLPYVLEVYGPAVHKPLAELADQVGIGRSAASHRQKAEMFIDAIRQFNRNMNIPTQVAELQSADWPLLVERTFKEANPFYPVPRILSRAEIQKLYERLTMFGPGSEASPC